MTNFQHFILQIPIPPQLKRETTAAFKDQITEEGFVDVSFDSTALSVRDQGLAGVAQLDLLLEEQKKVRTAF